MKEENMKFKIESTPDTSSQPIQNLNPSVMTSAKIQEYKETEPEKNNLMVLRDKLLEHRTKMPLQSEYYENIQSKSVEDLADEFNKSSNFLSNSSAKQLQQIDKVIAQNNQILMPNQPQQQKNMYINPQTTKPQPMYIMAPSPFQTMYVPQNFPGLIQQSIGPNQCPVQTINFNQPQAKNMTVQNISVADNKPIGTNTIHSYHYGDNSNIPIQQTSYMIINPTIQQQPQQVTGYQMIQPIIYVVPQNGMNFQNQYIVSQPQEISYTFQQQQQTPQQGIVYMGYTNPTNQDPKQKIVNINEINTQQFDGKIKLMEESNNSCLQEENNEKLN